MRRARRAAIVLPLLLTACNEGGETAGTKTPEIPAVTSCWVAPPEDTTSPIPATAPLVRYVDPHIGTGGLGFGVGSAFPGPQRPFGMIRPGPDTRTKGGAVSFAHCSGYAYEDTYIYGFSQTRMHGTGIVDYGTIGVMPTLGMTSAKTTAEGRMTSYTHDKEAAAPGSYEVTLDDGIHVAITAAERTALYEYTFPKSADATVLIDVGHALPDVSIIDGSVSVDAGTQVISGSARFSGGYSGRFGGMTVYFKARFTRPFAKFGVFKGSALFEGETARAGGDTGAFATFDATSDTKVGMAIAISFIDEAHAALNLDNEAPSFDFKAAKDAATAAWEEALGRVLVEARSERDLTITYSALYHTLLMPTLASESDGAYRGVDGQVHTTGGEFLYYTDLSLWDTYRTLHPWLSLVYPERQRDMLRSMMAMAKEGGAPPQWPLGVGETFGMVGDSSDVVFGDSWARGVRDFDAKEAYTSLRASAMTKLPKGGRDHVEEYMKNGWISVESGGSSASSTLEYALDDFALAGLAEAIGEQSDAASLRERSGSWKNLWDPGSKLLVGRYADGTLATADDPTLWQDYWAEGTTWHYTWFVPHDVPSLAAAMGGKDALIARLDDFFALSSCEPAGHLLPKSYYWHSNEPVLFIPWIFAELDDAPRTAKWTRWALANEYNAGPDGLPGNDDSGTMSAWWLFAASGFFPRIATSEYLIGAPVLPKVTLKLSGGDLVITAKGPSNGYPAGATLNGQKLARPRFDHSQITAGGSLQIELSPEPLPWK